MAAACAVGAVSSQRMISRAYHDSLFMARVAPTGMIFIPCRGGVSHRPDEYASPDAIGKGVEVLADTLARSRHQKVEGEVAKCESKGGLQAYLASRTSPFAFQKVMFIPMSTRRGLFTLVGCP